MIIYWYMFFICLGNNYCTKKNKKKTKTHKVKKKKHKRQNLIVKIIILFKKIWIKIIILFKRIWIKIKKYFQWLKLYIKNNKRISLAIFIGIIIIFKKIYGRLQYKKINLQEQQYFFSIINKY